MRPAHIIGRMSHSPDIAYPRLHDPELTLACLMQLWPAVIPVFIQYRLSCVGCPISRFHTIADICRIHALDPDLFRADLRNAINPAGSPR